MMNKLLNDNCKNKELLFHNEMDHEVQNGESVTQKFEVGISVVLADFLGEISLTNNNKKTHSQP